MSTLLAPSCSNRLGDETIRAQKLANAKKRLKSFRANRSTDTDVSASSSLSGVFEDAFQCPVPLVTDLSSNTPMTPTRAGRQAKDASRSYDLPPIPLELSSSSRSPTKLRKKRSKGNMHHRKASSVAFGSGTASAQGLMGLFESDDLEIKAPRGLEPLFRTTGLIASQGVPVLAEATHLNSEENPELVKSRLSTFTFGAKAPLQARSPSSRNRRTGQPLLPSQLLLSDEFSSPSSSPAKRLSTPHSRPPSLVLTRPTPGALGSPSPAGIDTTALQPPQTPPTPARSKRHSHTRSESISLPNLKFGSRPTSLAIPGSPSFPSSPTPPAHQTTPVPISRLKFEPSGRGAEAEMEKDGYRRKALEKLTGSPSPVLTESEGREIALPELDDEDTSSIASSGRPFSGSGSFNFGRPLSSSSNPSALSWSVSDDSPPLTAWSTGLGKNVGSEDALGCGFTFSGAGSDSFSFSAVSIPSIVAPAEPVIGLGLPSVVAARPPITRNLSVLAEVDESEEGDAEQEEAGRTDTHNPQQEDVPTSPSVFGETTEEASHDPEKEVTSGPSRLRELHLTSSLVSKTTTYRSSNPASSIGSPTKGYGALGRGRPALTKHAKKDSPFSFGSVMITPGKAGGRARPAESGPRSRTSSISYKRDTDSISSREWSISSKGHFSPLSSLGDIPSAPSVTSPEYSGWGAISRPSSGQPCPRPKSIVNMSHDNQGAGRVLCEVEEVNEDGLSSRNTSARVPPSATFDRQSSQHSGHSSEIFGWRDPQLELEIERDRLREEADIWKARYATLEEKFELERKENSMLRERARKLGDRISSMSSYPDTNRETSLVADLRNQLFGVKGELERERMQRQTAVERVAELEERVKVLSLAYEYPQNNTVNRPTASTKNDGLDEKILDEPHQPSSDPFGRMRAWGFPRGPVQSSSTKCNRESFFGLSQILRRDHVEQEEPTGMGVDLPPISMFPQTGNHDEVPSRSVSDPTPVASPSPLAHGTSEADETGRSVSLKSSASNALSFFTGYLPNLPRSNSQPLDSTAVRTSEDRIQRLPNSRHLGDIDLSRSCNCCVGNVLEV